MAVGNFPTGSQGNSEKSLFTGQGYGAAQVFSPDYEGMLATKKGLQDEATAKQEKADAGAYGVLGDLSKLSGALPGHADRLGREKIAFMERFKEDVKAGKHVNDPSWLPKKKAEAEFLIAGYKDSNDTYKNYMKLYEDVVKNPSAYDPKAIEDFKKILDPTSYSEFEDNIPAMVANAQQRMMNLQQKPKVELFDFATDPSFKSWNPPVKYQRIDNAGQIPSLDEVTLGEQAKEYFNSLPPDAKNQMIVINGDEDRAIQSLARAKAREVKDLKPDFNKANESSGDGKGKSFSDNVALNAMNINSKNSKGDIVSSTNRWVMTPKNLKEDANLTIKEDGDAKVYTLENVFKDENGVWKAKINVKDKDADNKEIVIPKEVNIEKDIPEGYDGVSVAAANLIGDRVSNFTSLFKENARQQGISIVQKKSTTSSDKKSTPKVQTVDDLYKAADEFAKQPK